MNNPDIIALYDEVLPLQNLHGMSGRYEYAKVRKGRDWYFLKVAVDKRLIPNIQREVVWREFMDRIEAMYPEQRLYGTHIERRIGVEALVFEYIDSPIVAAPHELEKWRQSIARYADMLEAFDRLAVPWKTFNLPTGEPSRSANVYDIWLGWLGDNASRVPRLEEAHEYIDRTKFSLRKCMQHGDLTPWQIFERGQDWVIFDGEKCGTDLFRFTDLAYGYGRLYTMLQAKDAARELLRQFMVRHGGDRDEFLRHFVPVLAHRSIGMLADAFNDEAQNDYVAAALELLDLCLDKRLEELGA